MEEIEVVINITKHEWEYLNKLVDNGDQLGHYERLIVNGTPLPQEPILNKIRADIRKLNDINPDYPMDRTIHISRNEVLQILDKYKAGSEGEE